MHEQRKKLIRYIIPAMFANISMFILTIVDGMFVGNGVGTDALGAVSLAMPFVMLVGAFSVLFNIGGVAVAAVRFGRGDNEGANQAFMHALTINAILFSAAVNAFLLLQYICKKRRQSEYCYDYIRYLHGC